MLILLTVAVAGAADPEAPPEEKSPSQTWEGKQVPLDEGALLTQSFLEDLSVYEPIYLPKIELNSAHLRFRDPGRVSA